jgi:hypothetical protein
MKNLIRFFAVLLLFVGYTSCDELDKLTEVDFNTTVTESIIANVDGGEDVLLNSNVLVNIDNPDTHDYLSKITKVQIISLDYRVVNFVGDNAGIITADLMADSAILDTHTGVTVSNVVGVMYSIDDTAALNIIANNLKNGNNVNFAVDGTTTNEGGMSFEIEITLSLKVTADAL